MRTSDPVWEQGFTFLVRNPETDTFFIRIEDQKTNSELGNLDINLNTLSDKANLEIVKQPFMLLKSGPQSKIILTLRLRVSSLIYISLNVFLPYQNNSFFSTFKYLINLVEHSIIVNKISLLIKI